MLTRRLFGLGLVSALAAPAVVRAASIMPVRNWSGVARARSRSTTILKPPFYANRVIRFQMDVEDIVDRNILLAPTVYDGAPLVSFRDIPIRLVLRETAT